MQGRCGRCSRVYEISDDFVAMGGRAKCPHCLLELDFGQQRSGGRADDRFWEATKPDTRRRPQPAPAAEPESDEIDALCGSCGRRYKVDRNYLESGGEALCPHCGVDLELADGAGEATAGPEPAPANAPEPEPEPEPEPASGAGDAGLEMPAGEASDGGWGEIEQQLVDSLDSGPEPEDDQQQPGWFATAQIDLPELELLRRQAEGAHGDGAVSEQQPGPDDEANAEPEAEPAWQPADSDQLAERQETDIWQAPDQEGDSWSIDEDDLPPGQDDGAEFEEADTSIDLAAPDGLAPGAEPQGEQLAPLDEFESPSEPDTAGQELDQQLGLEFSAEETVQLDEETGLPAGLEEEPAGFEEEPAGAGGRPESFGGEGSEPEVDSRPAPAGNDDMLSLFDDVSEERSLPGAGPLDLESPDQPEAAPAEDFDEPAAEQEESAGEQGAEDEPQLDESGWPADDLQQEGAEGLAASDLAEEADKIAGDAEQPPGGEAAPGEQPTAAPFAQLAEGEDWAQAAARWAESGFNPEDMPDFIAGEEPGEQPPDEAPAAAAEPEQPEGAPAPVDDASLVEVSDADILMVGDDEVEPLDEEPSRPEAPAEHWAARASRELAAKAGPAPSRERARGRLLQLLANPFVAGGIGLGVLGLLVVIWWLAAASEDIQGAVFPTAGIKAQALQAPPPSPYKARRGAVEHYALGNRLAHQGKFEEAILEYKQAIRMDPGFPHPHRALGVMYAALGRQALSAAAYENYLRLAPDTGDAAQVRQIIAASRK